MRKPFVLVIALVLATVMTSSAAIFENTFDEEKADDGSPDTFSVFGHEVMDRGVTKKTSTGGKQSAYIVADFGMETWGVIMIKDFGDWDLTDATLSADVRASTTFQGKLGVVGFKLIDADGTGYRSPEGTLYTPTASWGTFTQNVAELIPDEEEGETPGLDLQHIAQYGIIFFDKGDHNKMVSFYIDNFNATK